MKNIVLGMNTRKTHIFLIALWGLAILSVVVTCFFIFIETDLVYPIYVLFGAMISWGIISGLSYRDIGSVFRKYVSIRNPFATLFVTVALSSVLGAFFFQSVDPLEKFSYVYGFFRYVVALFVMVSILLGGMFLVGFVLAVTIRLSRIVTVWVTRSILARNYKSPESRP